MPTVRISAARFHSLLANRNLSPDDIAARTKTSVDPGALAGSDLDVEFADVEALAKVFKRPWSYLLIDEPEPVPDTGTDNRTLANRKVAVSPELLTELQAAELMLETASELYPDETFTVPGGAATDVPPDRLGAEIRSLLGVTIDDQLALGDEYEALRRWVAAIHGQGVYVSQRKLKDPTIRAFSTTLGDQALIVVDTGDTPYARIFSALHEYCHVALRSTGICDLDDHSTVERYCNAVAADVLLPSELLGKTVDTSQFLRSDEDADAALKHLSGRLHVSQAALLIRLRDHGSISQQRYETLELRRSARRGGGGGSKGGQYYPVRINRAGRLFAHRVVDAMTDGVIDRQDASVLLEIGEHSVPRFIAELTKGN